MRGIQSYRRSRVEGAPNEELLVMLIEAAASRVEGAMGAMGRGDRKAWLAEIHVARAIFIELRQALDHSAAPELTGQLDATYRWCIHHLTVGGRTGEVATLAEVHRVTVVLRDTWTQAVASLVPPADDDSFGVAS